MDENKLGLYKRLKIEKVKKDLDEIQVAGQESILLIAHRLVKELADQGYDTGAVDNKEDTYFSLFKYEDKIHINGHKFKIEE